MTAADLRAAIARQQIPIYQLAAGVNLHPSRLGAMLNEKIPMPASVVERLCGALRGAAHSEAAAV
jgi:hypothetical protein